eukprot:10398703-Alexandrium_andersonii.AAC.1
MCTAQSRAHARAHAFAAHGRTSSAAGRRCRSRGTQSVRKDRDAGVVDGNPPSRRERRGVKRQ